MLVCIDLIVYCQAVCMEICNHMGCHLFKIPVAGSADSGDSSSNNGSGGGVTTRSKAASKN